MRTIFTIYLKFQWGAEVPVAAAPIGSFPPTEEWNAVPAPVPSTENWAEVPAPAVAPPTNDWGGTGTGENWS